MGKNEKCGKWARLGSVTHGKTEECDKLENNGECDNGVTSFGTVSIG